MEHGVPIRQGAGVIKTAISCVLDDDTNDLTSLARKTLRDLNDDLIRPDKRIASISKEIKDIANADERARRLMTIPGIGAHGATVIIAAVDDTSRFKRAPGVAAWLGLVPRQHSTGGKQTLLDINKRGIDYLRRFLIQGASSCTRHLDRSKDRLDQWIDALWSQMHVNRVSAALYAKVAGSVSVVLRRPGATIFASL